MSNVEGYYSMQQLTEQENGKNAMKNTIYLKMKLIANTLTYYMIQTWITYSNAIN